MCYFSVSKFLSMIKKIGRCGRLKTVMYIFIRTPRRRRVKCKFILWCSSWTFTFNNTFWKRKSLLNDTWNVQACLHRNFYMLNTWHGYAMKNNSIWDYGCDLRNAPLAGYKIFQIVIDPHYVMPPIHNIISLPILWLFLWFNLFKLLYSYFQDTIWIIN